MREAANKTYSTVLVVKNRAMGDSVMGLSSLQYLRELYPQAQIIYAIPKWITPLYKNIDTAADEIIPIELKSFKEWIAFWKLISSKKLDAIYEMHQAGRSAKFFNIYSKIKRIPYFFHNHHLKDGTNVIDQGVIKSVIQRDLDGICSYMGDPSRIPNSLNYTPKINIEQVKKENYVILGVVATRETKMWPLEYYIELSKLIRANHPEIKVYIPLSRSSFDLSLKEKLNEDGLVEGVEIVHISLEELPNFMSKAKLYIGNDTGIKHLSVATGTKSYTLFGPEPPNEWHPYDSENHPYFYKDGLECRTRDAHYCGLSKCESMICLNQFLAEEVYEKIKGDL